ncbi:Vacuolar import and degradation protein 27 [Pichia kudriavzevii]|uniref:Vacuolar import and degradation protein 27 n=1 Tax=Pichia kudriavzevii TaxID=4909 RepID=A0A1V2LFW5_PICKU|nr:Vacuolar import and degradation protein 27 [Pichia kudriavzevii]
MNIVKRFLAKKQPVILDELIIIPSGQLYLVRSPSSPKSENECLYNDAALTIRNTIHQYNYELVLWKGNESDSDSLNDEEDENSEAQDEFFENESNVLKSFVIDQNLKVCLFERYGEKIISWKDMEGDFGDMFEYRINKSVPNDTIEQFMTCICKYEYEKKYEKSSEFVTAKELQEFIVERSELFDSCLDSAYTPSSSSTINMLQLLNKNENKVEYGEDNDSFYENSNSDSDSDSNSEGEDYAKFEDAAETLYSDISNDDLKQRIPLDDFPCKSYIYDPTSEEFKPKHLNVSVFLYELSNWTYCMEVIVLSFSTS